MDKNTIKVLSENIKLQRFKKKISQENCADKLNISIPTYRDLEYNPNKLSIDQAIILSQFLDLNILEIFFNLNIANCNK